MSAKIDPSTRRGATEGREPSLLPVWCEACKRTHYAPWCEPVPVAPSAAGERERFEEWAKDEGYYVFNDPINDDHPIYYTEENVRCMWQAWQARSSRAVAGVTEESLATEIFHASVREGLHFGNDLRSDFSKVAARVAIRMMGGGK